MQRWEELGSGLVPFSVELSTGSAAGEVRLSGELDLSTAPRLRAVLEHLLQAGHVHLTVDLARLTFLDCAGLSVLIAATEHHDTAGGRLTLRNPSPTSRRVLTVLELDDILHIEEAVS